MRARANGLSFTNRYALQTRARAWGPLRLGPKRLSYGLCGGMCYTALDYFHAGLLPPALHYPPASGTPLHRYLLRRQLDSWRYATVPLRTLWWTLLNDRALARRTVQRELPRLLKSLNQGVPAVILLVRVRCKDPTLNHQVVVTGYTEDREHGRVQLELYDPNHEEMDVTLTVNSLPQSEELAATQSTGETLRGFFVLAYRPRLRGLPLAQAD
ncbi:MAG: hypothetical protein ACOX2L_09610 [Anaerolineae bacterium]|nr:hypothetical protein [Chloroflexota bacterium]